MAFDKDKDTTKSTGGGYQAGDYGSYREAEKSRSTSVGAGRGSSAGGPTTASERTAASKSGTSSSSKSTGYGESRTSVADRDRQGLGNVASNRSTSSTTGYGAGRGSAGGPTTMLDRAMASASARSSTGSESISGWSDNIGGLIGLGVFEDRIKEKDRPKSNNLIDLRNPSLSDALKFVGSQAMVDVRNNLGIDYQTPPEVAASMERAAAADRKTRNIRDLKRMMDEIEPGSGQFLTGLSPQNVGLVTAAGAATAASKAAAAAKGARFVSRYLEPAPERFGRIPQEPSSPVRFGGNLLADQYSQYQRGTVPPALVANLMPPSEGGQSEARRRIDPATYGDRVGSGNYGEQDRGARVSTAGPGRGTSPGGEYPNPVEPNLSAEFLRGQYGQYQRGTPAAATAAAPPGFPGWPQPPNLRDDLLWEDRRRYTAPVPPTAATETTVYEYDLETPEGIKEFQRDNGLVADGIIGPETEAMFRRLSEESVPTPTPAPRTAGFGPPPPSEGRGFGAALPRGLPADMDPRIYGPGEIAPGPQALTTNYLPEFRSLTPAEGPIPEAATRAAAATDVSDHIMTRDEIVEMIKEGQRIRGITGDVPLNIAIREGLNANPAEGYQSTIIGPNGKREKSFGVFQLNVNSGVGKAFIKDTGLDPRDPLTTPAQINYTLDWMVEHGVHDWSAAKNVLGYDKWEGMRDAHPAAVDRMTTQGIPPEDRAAPKGLGGAAGFEARSGTTGLGKAVELPDTTRAVPFPRNPVEHMKGFTERQYDELDPETQEALSRFALLEGEIRVNSGYRDKTHNEAVGGVPGSEHIKRKATDVSIRGKTDAEKTQSVINARLAGWNRIGAYTKQGALHLDMGTMPPRGGYDVYAMFDTKFDRVKNSPQWFKDGLSAPLERGVNTVASGGEGATTPSTVPAAATVAETTTRTPRSAAQQAESQQMAKAAADRAKASHPAAVTTPVGQGYLSNISQRAVPATLKPTVPPQTGEYKRGLGGDIGAGIIDFLVGGSGLGIGMQAGAVLLTGDTVGGNVVDRVAGGKPNYYQPGSLDRQSDSSGEQVRTDPTRRFQEKYLAAAPTATGVTPVVAAEEIAVPFNDPTVRPTPAEKWGSMNTWARSYT